MTAVPPPVRPRSWPAAAWLVAGRDLILYLRSPIALVVAGAFLVLQGVSFAAVVSVLSDPERPAPLGALLESHFGGGVVAWAAQLTIVAALASRLAAERRAGTWEALVTAPAPESAALVGVWLAALVLYALLWLPTLIYLAVVIHYAPAGASIDPGPVAAAVAGEIAVGGAGLALALAAAAPTRQPEAATVAGFAVLMVWLVAGELPGLAPGLAAAHPDVAATLTAIGPRPVVAALARGEVHWTSLAGLAALTAGGLRAAVALVGSGRRRHGQVGAGLIEAALVTAALGLGAVLIGRAAPPWDVTAAHRNSLEPATRTVLDRVADPIAATVIRPGLSGLDPIYDEVERVLARVHAAQPLVRVGRWDPLARQGAPPADAAAALADEDQLARTGAVVISRGPRRRVVALLDLAEVGRDALAVPTARGLRIEAALTGALAQLVDDAPVRVCATRGHGELPIDGTGGWSLVARRLVDDGMTVDAIDVIGGVPAACTVVAVIGPTAPLGAAEAEAIGRFLDGGGRVLVAPAGGDVDDRGRPVVPDHGLATVLGRWGVTTPPAWVIDPALAGDRLWSVRVVDGYAAHPIVAGFAGRRFTTWRRARPVVRVGAAPDDVAVDLVTTTARGRGETDLTRAPGGDADRDDVPGPVVLAVAVERGRGRLVVLGSALTLTGVAAEGDAGPLLGARAIGWLAGRVAPVAVPAKDPEGVRLIMSGRQRLVTSAVVVALVPAAAVALLWLLGRRRRRR